MPNLKINNKTYSGVSEVHIPLADGSGNEDFAYINSETKSITENGTHDVKHYGTVNVNVPTEGDGITPTGTKTITENGTYDVTEYANAKVEVPSEEPNIQSLNVTANGTYTAPSGIDGYSPITVNVPTESDIELQQKTVTPSETAQTITPDSGYDGLASVSVGAISKTYVGSGVTKKSAQTYTPGTSNQTIASGQYLNGTQTIQGDSDLVAGNIKSGVSIFGVTGTYEGEASDPVLQSKTVSPSTSQQTVTPDSGYAGLSQVTVNAMPTATLATPSISVNANGTITASLYQNNSGYVTAGSSKTKTATLSSAYDSDFIASNIKKGVTIFGLAGTYEGESSGGGGLPSGISKLASDTVTPTDNVVYQDIKHGLGVAPNFLIWFVENDVGTTGVASLATDGSLTIKRVKMNTSSSTVYNVHYVTHGYNASTQFGQTAGKYSNSTDMTATIARMRTASPYYFKSGYTYRWICGVADGVL